MCLAATVYAEQLLPKGHGYPLWIPEPDTTVTDDQVRIGDVGYIWEGSFCTLFNVTLPASHPINRNGVPEGFVPLEFNTTELVRTRDTYLPDAPVYSQTVRCLTAAAQAGTSSSIAPVGGQMRLSFECVGNKGGLLILNGGGAIQEVLRPNKTFPEYMHTYHDSWCDFAAERGHDVLPEDIIMVRGTVKASQWTVAAFTDETRYQSLQLEAQGGGLGSAGVSVSLSDASSMSVEHRSGRSKPQPMGNQSPMNQCVFLSRYKMRYRKWPWKNRKIRAAGQRDDEPSSDSESEDGISTQDDSEDQRILEDDTVRTAVRDPLDIVIDYILENSQCYAAMASDEDMKDLCEVLQCPASVDGFREQLHVLHPHISVSVAGVGCLSNMRALCSPYLSAEAPPQTALVPLATPPASSTVSRTQFHLFSSYPEDVPHIRRPPSDPLPPVSLEEQKPHSAAQPSGFTAFGLLSWWLNSTSPLLETRYNIPTSRAVYEDHATPVWPRDVDVALFEGLHYYNRDEHSQQSSLPRSLRSSLGPCHQETAYERRTRNCFISDYILRTTGHRRTSGEINSRLAELQDTLATVPAIFPRGWVVAPMNTPSQEDSSPLPVSFSLIEPQSSDQTRYTPTVNPHFRNFAPNADCDEAPLEMSIHLHLPTYDPPQSTTSQTRVRHSVRSPNRDFSINTLAEGVRDFLKYVQDNPPEENGDHSLELGLRGVRLEYLYLAGLHRVSDTLWRADLVYYPRGEEGRGRRTLQLRCWVFFVCLVLCTIGFSALLIMFCV